MIDVVLNYIKNTDFSNIPDGRIDITDSIWANLQTYTTKEDALFEAHRKYIDVQYIISGEEKIGVADYSICKPNIPYDDDKDIEFLDCSDGKYVELHAGEYLVLYPKDAHKPSITIDKPTTVRKLVAKIPIEIV